MVEVEKKEIIEFGKDTLKFYEESLKFVDNDKKDKLAKELKEFQAIPDEYKNASLVMMQTFSKRLCDAISSLIEITLFAYKEVRGKVDDSK